MTADIGHLLNRQLQVWRETAIPDGGGGQDIVYGQVGTVPARVSQPTARERDAAHQAGAELTHTVHLLPGADVRRRDELRDGDALVLFVFATFGPSEPVYLRADCTERQPTTTGGG